jgi:chemotaxis protein histidine kinase CheA/ActR/RegA family two-component response regulator
MAEQHDRILGYFLEEAVEHLNTIEQGLRRLPETVRQPTTIRELFRAAHSIKGSAAMLGLLDIQKIGNQFEANFRLLKEQPQIAVDSHLQSLFLESFGFLRAGIEEVRVSADPYRQDPATPDPIGDPVFEELKAYLQHLLATVQPAQLEDASRKRAAAERDPAIEQVFGEYVTRKLDEIIGLCLQPDRPEIRTQIQQLCQKLGNLGENFEFLEWTNLFTAFRLAIANPANLLPQLGETISIAVKQAQVLVLADRHQSIKVTPDLEALIIGGAASLGNRADRQATDKVAATTAATTAAMVASTTAATTAAMVASSPQTVSNLSTWNISGSEHPTATSEDTTQKFPELLSINGSIAAASTAGTTDDLALSAVELDPDAMELNEFMNLLSDDMPTEGTWMQEEDFLDRDMPLGALGDAATDKFYSQMFEPARQTPAADDIAALALAIDLQSEQSLQTYDEETFYTPDLAGIDDGNIPMFWSDAELAIAPQQALHPLGPIDDADLQLQPTAPLPDLGDSPAPDFGLDRPISELFPTVASPDELPAANEVAAPVAAIDQSHPRQDADALDLNSSPVLETPVANDLHAQLEIPSIREADNNLTNINGSFELNTDFDRTNGEISSTSDVLFLEELNGGRSTESSDLLFLEDLNSGRSAEATVTTDPIGDEFASWIDRQDVDDFADLNLESLDDELGADALATDHNFSDLRIDRPLGSESEQEETFNDFTDLDFGSISSNSSPDPSLDFLGSNDTLVNLSVSDDLLDLVEPTVDANLGENLLLDRDFADLDSISSGNDIAFNDLDFTPDRHDFDDFDELELNSSIDNMFADLDLDSDFSDSSLPTMDNTSQEAVATSQSPELAALNLTSLAEDRFDADLADLDLQAIDNANDLDMLDEMESSSGNDLAELDLHLLSDDDLSIDGIEPSLGNDMAELDLDLLGDRELNIDGIESSLGNDLGDLDFNALDEGDLNISEVTGSNVTDLSELDFGEAPTANFEDLSELDFNLDDLSSDLGSPEALDMSELTTSNLPDLGNLDALLGVAAVGAVGAGAFAIGANLGFDDLDALVSAPEAAPAASLDDLDGLLATPVPAAIAPPTPPVVEQPKERRAKQSRTFEQTMKVSVKYLDNLNNLVGELVVNRNTLEQDQNRMRQFVEKLLSEVQKLNEVGKRMQDLYERSLMENSLVASRQQSKPTIPNPQISLENPGEGTLMEYDPLEMDRFTPIHLLSQKMIELTVRVRESTADIEFVVDGSTEVTRTLRQITGQLQEDLTKSRMVPFAQTADRLQRGVRDNGLKYGKQIELNVEGRDTLIDKVILESLTDPLIHMVNNGIAHGIESTETRLAAGKPSEGKITIRAIHQGNQTIISISDDGAGIDTNRVKNKAIEKGIITAEHAATMSKSEIYDLLFLPSFSTKDQADELAGRGVGMDVVRTSITDIRGTITTESQLGVGTTFTIRLPLALSIAKALIAVNNKSNIAFPMDGIEDTQDVSPEQIQTNSDGEQCIFWRDEMMPFKPLSDLLAFNRPLARNNFYSTNEDDSDLVSILILRSDGNFTAVQVDKITGDQEIVIKPLQGPAAKPLGIAGATVMGDGRIVPIADVMELISLAKGTLVRQVSTQWADGIATPTVEVRESMVLIVDDSITVRELLSLTFKRAGYRVEQARDGQEAWDKLRAGLPCDIVFCDIEMPRMDGLEFLSRIQKDTALSKVPVAMLTSRGSDRHRQIASQLGASGYFIKPYLEEALLDAAKRMIKGEVLEIV